MNPENDFKLHKENANTHWRKNILVICSIVAILILIIEIGIFATFRTTNDVSTNDSNMIHYILLRIVIPTTLNFVSLIVTTIICKNKNSSSDTKNFAVTLTIFVTCPVISIFHNFFNVLLVACAFPFFLCTIFGDSKLMEKLGIITIPAFILSVISFWLNEEPILPVYKILTILCAFTFIFCSYFYANALLAFQKKQLDYIQSSYHRQFELLEELRIDPLTNIANRISMKEIVTNAISRAEKDNINSYLVMIDLDLFKSVNDRFGHTSGDTVLVKLAEILKANTEYVGTPFRYGGEEFILVFENTNLLVVDKVTEKICSDFSKTRFDFSPDETFTLSAGISIFNKGFSITQWIDASDAALYYAKTHGRNQICHYEEIKGNSNQ